MRKFYFVVPSLPPLVIGEPPPLSFEELMARLGMNLKPKELKKIEVLRRFIDIYNIRAFLMEEEIDLRGNLGEKELDEALLVRASFPEYLLTFLNQFEKATDKLKHFAGLLSLFFKEEVTNERGFLRRYLQFERESRLVLLALRAKKLRRDVAVELQFEEPTDFLVAQILAQKDAEAYEPPLEYADLKKLIMECGGDPWLENKAFAEYRFKKISQMVEGELFTFDVILAYTAKLMIVEDLLALDARKGMMILETFKSG